MHLKWPKSMQVEFLYILFFAWRLTEIQYWSKTRIKSYRYPKFINKCSLISTISHAQRCAKYRFIIGLSDKKFVSAYSKMLQKDSFKIKS